MYLYVWKKCLIGGFRRPYLTDSLLYITDFKRKQTDGGILCGMVPLDLQKAYITVNHSILLDKISVTGSSNMVIAWLNSCLTGRIQRVEIDVIN